MNRPQYPGQKVMTVRELSAYLRVHPSTIYRLLKRHEIPAFRVGSDCLAPAASLGRPSIPPGAVAESLAYSS
jgi:excisionase family DNA binding protein